MKIMRFASWPLLFVAIAGLSVAGCGENANERDARLAREAKARAQREEAIRAQREKDDILEEVKKLDIESQDVIETNSVITRLRELAKKDVVQAQGVLASKLLILKDYENAKYWASKSADCGDGRGMNVLGLMCQHGWAGYEKSPEKAFDWFKKSADAGCSKGYLNLALAYKSGVGCQVSKAEVLKNLKNAVALNDPYACWYLGMCYIAETNLVACSEEEGVRWIEKAVDLGDKGRAKLSLAMLYYKKGCRSENGGETFLAKAFTLLGELEEEFLAKQDYVMQKMLWEAIQHFGNKGDIPCERKIARVLSAMKSSSNPDYRWLGKYRLLLLDFNENKQLRGNILSEMKNMAETSNVWQRAEITMQLGIIYSQITPFVDYNEAAKWLEKSAMTGTQRAVDKLVELRVKYIEDFPGFMKVDCNGFSKDKDLNFCIGHGLLVGAYFVKNEEAALPWLILAARHGSVAAYIDLIDYWEKKNASNCEFCLRQAALLNGQDPASYRLNLTAARTSADEKCKKMLEQVFGGARDEKLILPRIEEYDRGVCNADDSDVLPKKESKDVPFDELFENPRGTLSDENSLKSLFGVEFGSVIKKNIKPLSTTKNGLAVYGFSPKKRFRDFNEYAVYASPMTRRVVHICAKAPCDYSDISSQAKQMESTVVLLEEKYKRKAEKQGDGGNSFLMFRSAEGVQTIVLGVESDGFEMFLIGTDRELLKASDGEVEEQKRIKRQAFVESESSSIDAL